LRPAQEKLTRSYLKNKLKNRRNGDVVQVAEHKHKTLGSICSAKKKKKGKPQPGRKYMKNMYSINEL
jgi:hypothetical protein